jgi:hypothetical protein
MMRRAVPSSIQIDAISIDIGAGIHAVVRTASAHNAELSGGLSR